MGVSGCGKSSVAEQLAQNHQGSMIEADELHCPKSVEKMHRGIALCDEDRWPWLKRVAQELRTAQTPVFVSCSSLRHAYRLCLLEHAKVTLGFIHLHASEAVLEKRLLSREGHFMPASLLKSQLDTLEPLQSDERGVVVDVAQPISDVVEDAMIFTKQMLSV